MAVGRELEVGGQTPERGRVEMTRRLLEMRRPRGPDRDRGPSR